MTTTETKVPASSAELAVKIIDFLKEQDLKKGFVSLNPFLEKEYDKEYKTRDFAKTIKQALTNLEALGKIKVHGHQALDLPYWEPAPKPTQYRTADQVNLMAKIIDNQS